MDQERGNTPSESPLVLLMDEIPEGGPKRVLWLEGVLTDLMRTLDLCSFMQSFKPKDEFGRHRPLVLEKIEEIRRELNREFSRNELRGVLRRGLVTLSRKRFRELWQSPKMLFRFHRLIRSSVTPYWQAVSKRPR